MNEERTIVVLSNDSKWNTTSVIFLQVDISPDDAEAVFGHIGWSVEGMARGRIVWESDLYEPNRLLREFAATPHEYGRTAKERSSARVRAMELGFAPWPSASGWAPMDLPWLERRILIGIVEGVADLARWAHEIWLRDEPARQAAENARIIAEWEAAHPSGEPCPVCPYCGSPRCTDGSC